MGDRITSLPADVRSLLRTGVTITHVAQCVEELVVNALDAGATCVATRVDLPCFKVQVVDNGRGIRYDDLNLIGERYATSKCHEVNDLENLHYYGYRGEALASLCDITSVLEINSRSQSSTQTYCKIFQQGKSIQISDSTIPRSSAGTTITVYDLFYNLPVRKKCCNPSLDLEKVRQKIEGIALIKPAVSFSLRNDVTGNVILQTHKTNSILNTFTYLFSPARSKSLTEVDGKEGNFSVQGYIGKSGSNKKDYQFIYINGRLVLKTKLHKTVNRQLSKSLILRKKLELTSSRFRGRIMTTSPTKTTDQHAIFVLNVVCPYKEYDITFEPAKTLVEFKDFEVLQHCLENIITDFLKRENLHLGILMENFGKKEMTKSPSNGNNSDEEIDEVKDQDQNVGLKLKPEIRTTDRNGLFSKVVKRKIIPETVVDRDENCDSQSSSSDTREIIATENNDPNTSSELNVKVLQKGNSETNKTVNSKSSSTNTLDNLKTPQNKIAVLNLCPNIHVPDNSENKNVDQELSGNKQNDPHVIIVNSNMDEKIDVDDEEKIYVTSRDSCSEGELSEDPLPTEQRKQPLPQRKQLICIDTPIVREAKINISALSKLRKRKSTEDCTSLAKSLEKHQKFTKLKEMDRDDSLGGEKTKGNLLLGKRSLEKTTISNEGEVNENNPTHNSESIMTSSLQGLRKFRAKENKSNANIEGNNNGQSLKYSLQELRKHRAQTASTSNCDRTKEDSFKDILQDRNLTGTSFSTSKNISEKVVRFDENKHMELDSRQPDQSESRQRLLDSRQPDQSESRQRLLDSRQPDQSESRQRLLDSIQSSQSDESRQRLLDSIQSGQSESRQRLLDSIQSDQSESWQRQLDSIQSDQRESWQTQLDNRQSDQSESKQRQLDSRQSDQSESRQTQLDNRQSDQSESKQRQLDSRQSDQSESRQRHNAGDSESCENDKTNLLKREDNKFSEFIENKRKSTIDNLLFSNASEMFVDLPPGPDSYKESSGLKENCQISKHLVQAQTTMVSQKQMGILSNDSGNISSPIDIDEACQSLENCITEIENVISSSEKEREIATDMSQQIPTSLLTATISNSGDGIGSNVFANRTKSFMSSDQMIQTAQTFMEKYEDDQKRDSVEKCGKNKSNNNMSQDLQMDMKKQAALDVDIRYVAQPILHSNKLFNVDDRVQASESLGIDSSSESMTQDMFSSDCSQGEVPSCSYRKAKSFETSKSRTRNADNFMSENSYQQELNNRSMFTLTEHNLNLSKAMNSLENKERVLPSQSISFLSYFDVDGSNNLPGTQQKSEITTVQDTKLPFEIYLKHMQKNVKMTSSDETDDFLLCRESMKEIDELQTCFGQTQEFLVAEDSCIVTEYKDMDTSDTEENEIGIEFVHNVPVFERKMTISPCLSEGFSPAMDTENDIDSTGSKNVEEMTPVELSNTCRQYINSSLNNCLSSLKDYSDSRTEVPLSPQNKVGCIDIVPTISESAASVDSTRPYFSSAKLVQSESLHQSESKGERLSGTRLTCKKSFEDISGSSNSKRTTICSGTTFDKSAELFSNYSLTRHQNSDTSSSCLESQNKHVHTENNLKSQNVSDSKIFNIMISHRSEVHNEGFIKTASNMENKVSNAHSNEEMMSSEKCEDENNDEEMFSLDGDREICEISHQTQSNDKMTGVVTSTPCSARKGDTDELFSPDGDCQLRDVQYESKTWVEMTDPKSGNKLYVNTRSGHSISSDVWTPPDEDTAVAEKEDINSTDLNRQCSPTELSPGSSKLLKDMMSHHLSNEDDELKSIKWKDSTQINTDSRKVEDLFDKWENPVFTMAPQNLPSTQINHMSRASTKAYQTLNPCVFDKDMLNKFKVLGQVDNKFIACSLEGGNSGEEMLVLIDQHAAHERIRLEDLTKEAYEMTDGVKVICQSELTTDVELTFPEEVVRVMSSFVEDFKTIGIKFSVDKNKRDSVILHTLPSCILQKDSFDRKKKKDTTAIKAAQNLIKEYVEVLQDTRGSRGRLPSTIHKVLCSQACHGAIKFGDPLTLTECKDLLKSLTKCKLPFQCAHGRPSVVPLIQLQNKRQERKRPNLWKIARNIQH